MADKKLAAMTDVELEALYVEVANEKSRRESREGAHKALLEAVATSLPTFEAYAHAYGLTDEELGEAICQAMGEARKAKDSIKIAQPKQVAPEWEQPGSTRPPYKAGELVTFQGKTWRSIEDNNTWPPSAYPQGWEEVNNG